MTHRIKMRTNHLSSDYICILSTSEIGVVGRSRFFLISYFMSKVLFLPFEGAKLILASSFYIPTVSFFFPCYRLQFGHMR